MRQHLNLIEAIAVADMDTTRHILDVLSKLVESYDGAIETDARRKGIGEEIATILRIGEGDMMAIRRHQSDIHILLLNKRLCIAR